VKKTLFLLIIIAALAGIWSSAWYYVAGKVEEILSSGQSRLAVKNIEIQCPGQAISGFPFRINLDCSETSYSDTQKGFSLQAGALRSAAQAYQPGKAVIELDSPAVVTLARHEFVDLEWTSLRASVSAGFGGLEKFSTVGTGVSVVPSIQGQEPFTMQKLQVHGRKVETNDVDLAVVSDGVKSQNALWPGFDLALTVRLENIYDQLSNNPDLKQIAVTQGLTGQLTELNYISSAGGQISVSGPMQINQRGLLSGRFNISVSEIQPIIRSLSQAFPQQSDLFQQAEVAAGLLNNGQAGNTIKLPITVREGQASLGLIPIGVVPPLF